MKFLLRQSEFVKSFLVISTSSCPIDLDDIDEKEKLDVINTKGKQKSKQIVKYWEHFKFVFMRRKQMVSKILKQYADIFKQNGMVIGNLDYPPQPSLKRCLTKHDLIGQTQTRVGRLIEKTYLCDFLQHMKWNLGITRNYRTCYKKNYKHWF